MKHKIFSFFQLVKNLLWILTISYSINKVKFCIRVLTTLCYVFFPILSYWFLKQIIDLAVGATKAEGLALITFLYLIALKISFDVGWYFLDTFLEGLFKIMRFDLEAFFAETIVKKLNTLDLGFFENSSFLDLKQKALDTYTWRPTEMLNIAFWSLYNVVQIIVQSVIIAQISFVWLAMLFLFQIPSLIILLRLGQSAWNIQDADSTTRRKFQYFAGLFENVSYIKEFILYDVGDYFIGKIRNLLGEFHTHQKQIEKKRVVFGFGGVVLSNFPVWYITVELLLKLVFKEITAGLLLFYLNNLGAFSLALSNLVKNINYGYEVNLYIAEIRKFLELKNLIVESNNPVIPNIDKGISIDIQRVHFRYPNSKRKVFSDFSLTIKAKTKIAFVGENGSGKTTLIKLLSRFYDVQEGKILINGVDIRLIPLQTLRSLFATLFQDYVGYDLTVNENIGIGKIGRITDEFEIRNAATMAGADTFIQSLPQKYKQQLGTAFMNGEQLSTGEWQRIALAKAFIRNSHITILDEPTAAVDAKTEHEIFNRVLELVKNKTVIMISHRFSTVRNADEIIVLKKGKIIEHGRHEELMDRKGEYAEMFNLQAKAYN